MAVTRAGIPVRVWCWPGNTGDQALIRQVKDDMRDWTLGRVVWVADRGFSSDENRRYLRAGGGHYIIGEKLRSGSTDAEAALSRQGRYAIVADNMQVKEVKLDDADDRFVDLLQPRRRRTRQPGTRADRRPARGDDRRLRRPAARPSGHNYGASSRPNPV